MSSFSLLRSLSNDTQSTPIQQKGRAKRFSFHSKQHHSVIQDFTDTSSMKGVDVKKSKAFSRRWSSLKQYETTTLSQQSLNSAQTGGSGVLNGAASSTRTSPHEYKKIFKNSTSGGDIKKPKWEVIEHYKGVIQGRETISSSLLAVIAINIS